MRDTRGSNLGKLALFAAILFLVAVAPVPLIAQSDTENKSALVEKVSAYSNPLSGELLDKFVTLNLSPQCWAKLSSGDSQPDGVGHASRIGKAIQEHAKLMGYGDLDDAISGIQIDRSKADPIIARLRGNFSYTINAKSVPCNDEQYRLLAAYSLQIISFFGDSSSSTYGMNRGWHPRGGKMFVTLDLSPTAKDIAVTVSPDGTSFTVTAPVNTEPGEWDVKIEKGLARGGSGAK